MLTIYRRHEKDCPHRPKGRNYRRCRCPIWVDGFLGDKEIRHSLKLHDWEKAQQKIREMESPPPEAPEPARVGIIHACAQYLRECRTLKLKPATLYKYRVLFHRLRAFANHRGLRFLEELDLEQLRAFRAGWPDHDLSALKNLERLRAFFHFCHESDWIESNPAGKLKNPKVTRRPTLPFSREQVVDIVNACAEYPDRSQVLRVRAFVLLLRYSGLRIRDVVTLRRDRIDKDGRLFLYTAKTGTPVNLPLPPLVINALDQIALPSSTTYFFWTGESKPKSAVGDWQRTLRRVFILAGLPDGHAHRFRDTFAVELLLAGVPIERVSALLGHQNVRVTQDHYAPWVSERQEQLEADVKRTWVADSDLQNLDFAKGTPKVHEFRRLN